MFSVRGFTEFKEARVMCLHLKKLVLLSAKMLCQRIYAPCYVPLKANSEMFTYAKIGKSKPFHKYWDGCKLL